MSVSDTPKSVTFQVPASNIFPLSEPSDYYSMLLNGVQTAQSRVTMAFFYTTTNALEQNLIQALTQRCVDTAARGQQIDVRLMVDYQRTLWNCRTKSAKRDLEIDDAEHVPAVSDEPIPPERRYESGAHLLLELLTQSPDQDRTSVGLLRLPASRKSWLMHLVPSHYRDALAQMQSVSHMKFFVFDNDVVVTGANVSTAYFSNRQDRYLLLKDCPALADYFTSFVRRLTGLPGGFMLRSDGQVCFNEESGEVHPIAPIENARQTATAVVLDATKLPQVRHPPKLSRHLHGTFNSAFADLLRHYCEAYNDGTAPVPYGAVPPEGAAIVSPRFQLGSLGINYDFDATLKLFRNLGPCPTYKERGVNDSPIPFRETCHLATGYFNLAKPFYEALIKDCHPASSVHVLSTSPDTMDFSEACACFSGSVKTAYSEISRRFYQHAEEQRRCQVDPHPTEGKSGVAIYEYLRKEWTFHGKGIWIDREYPTGQREMITSVGSSNFGRRSRNRDLEMQVEIRTQDAELIRRLQMERDGLFAERMQRHQVIDNELRSMLGQDTVSVASEDSVHVQPVGPGAAGGDVWHSRDRKLHPTLGPRGYWVRPASKVCADVL